jgi:hypothetical protein
MQGRGFVLKKLQTPDGRVCWSAPLFIRVLGIGSASDSGMSHSAWLWTHDVLAARMLATIGMAPEWKGCSCRPLQVTGVTLGAIVGW